MTSNVEARSLAFLTSLASDPPIYPVNPTHDIQDSLTLYIVRVPGSKDVFLTPLKPRDKVVSAHDVQSSLYYLHVDDPEDSLLLSSEDEQPMPSTGSFLNPVTQGNAQIYRKPLPTPPVSPVDFSRESLEDRPRPLQVPRKPLLLQRKPVVSRQPTTSGDFGLPTISPQMSRRPLPSPRGSYDGTSQPSLPNPSVTNRLSSHLRSSSGDQGLRMPYTSESDTSPNQYTGAGLSLTLIRRDPSSGAQWNVAKIRDPPVQEVSSESATDNGTYKAKRSGRPLFIEVSNPGYTKFLHSERSRPVSRNSTAASFADSDLPSDGVFRRRLWMDGSKFADHGYTPRKLLSSDSNQRGSRSSLQFNMNNLKTSPRAAVDKRSKGYSFHSPWGGRCDFMTGTAGRSLKCKHFSDYQQGRPADISELRFNLPTSGAVAPDPDVPSGNGTSSKRLSVRPPLHRHTTSDLSLEDEQSQGVFSRYFDENGNIDLSLGQERAGGGLYGKRAKLGKLIIDDLGLRMLDLTVAANMALWWRAYERV